ncbi:MAG: ParB/RepB/Spo0J family partition protein [Myxococcaceae bacterium]
MPVLPEAPDPAAPPPTWRIALELIEPNPHQPRREFDAAPLSELVESIREHGLLQPVSVRRIPGGRYQLIAGHRRLEAYRRLLAEARGKEGSERFETIPAHEKFDVTDEEMALFALVENLQRDDLSPLDAALGLSRFQVANELSTEALAQRTGLEVDRVKRLLRLARAPKVVQDACHEGVLIEQVDEQGTVKLLASGNAKRERARLDLMAALEFARAHSSIAKTAPKKADERTAKAIERALSERWTLRRVQTFCRGVVSGSQLDGSTGEGAVAAARVALFTDGAELRIRRSQLAKAAPGQRSALVEVLRALLAELTA